MGHLYVNDDLKIVTGADAEKALETRSDAQFLDEQKGVVRVSRERWETAQRYEDRTWNTAGAEAHDDRNEDHSEGFGGYAALSGRTFRHAIELGCGPFTNLRLIARHCRIESCSLLDPLIPSYLHHRHRTYDQRHLHLGRTPLGDKLGATLPGRALRRLLGKVAPSMIEHRLPVRELLPVPIEEMPPRGGYDLVVIINVLEHCYDAEAIFAKIAAMLAPGGILVFHDKLFDADEAARDVAIRYDAGHPLRVGADVIEAFLAAEFDPLYRRDSVVADGCEDVDLSRNAVYFIGRKKR